MSPRWLVQSSVCLTKSVCRGVLASVDSNEPRNYSRSRRMCVPFSRALIPTTTRPRTHEAPKSRAYSQPADFHGVAFSLQRRTAESHGNFIGAGLGAGFAHFIRVADVAPSNPDR